MSRYLLLTLFISLAGTAMGRGLAAAETVDSPKSDNDAAQTETAAVEESAAAAESQTASDTKSDATEPSDTTTPPAKGDTEAETPAAGQPAAAEESAARESAAASPQVSVYAMPEAPSSSDEPTFPKHAFLLSWDMAVPVGDTWRYINSFSPAGVTFNYRYHFTPQLAVGALFGWNSFDVKEKGTFHFDNVTVTGTQIRSMDALHFGAGLYYNILPITKKVVPFVGIDLETYHLQRTVDFGWWSAASSDWHFGFAPSIGALFHMPGITVLLSSKFQMAVQTPHSDAETYVSFNIGLGLD